MLDTAMSTPSAPPLSPRDAGHVQCVFRDSLTPAVTCVLVGFGVMAVSYALRFPWPQRLWPVTVAAACAVWMAALRWWLGRHTLPVQLSNAVSQLLVLLVLINLCVALSVTRDDHESLHFGLLVIGAGLLFVSWPCLIFAIVMVLGGWLATVWLADVPMLWVYYPHTMLGCVILAGMAMMIRRAAIDRLVAAMQAEQQRQEHTARLAQQLASREREYRDLFNGMLDPFAVHELVFDDAGNPCDSRFIEVNNRLVEMMGRPRDMIMGKRIKEMLTHPDPMWLECLARVARTGKAEHFESYSRLVGRTLEVVVYAIDERRVAVLFTDITDRRAQEQALMDSEAHYRAAAESNRRLLSEVNHRVRNNLASLTGLLTLVRRQARDVAHYHAAIEQRIAAMTHVHNLLADANWGDLALNELITRLLASMQRSAPRQIPMLIDGPPVSVIPRQIAPLTMTLVELFTNSCKHGAHCSENGTIDITWQIDRHDGHPRVHVRWRERGGPTILGSPTRSMGTELIEGFVAFELGGRATLRFHPDGVDHSIEFPAMGEVHAR